MQHRLVLKPKFGVSHMMRGSELSRTTHSHLAWWRHYSFHQLLCAQAKRRDSVTVLEVSEAWSSKTCCRCIGLVPDLGASRRLVCPRCDAEDHIGVDRDANAAIGTFAAVCTPAYHVLVS